MLEPRLDAEGGRTSAAIGEIAEMPQMQVKVNEIARAEVEALMVMGMTVELRAEDPLDRPQLNPLRLQVGLAARGITDPTPLRTVSTPINIDIIGVNGMM